MLSEVISELRKSVVDAESIKDIEDICKMIKKELYIYRNKLT